MPPNSIQSRSDSFTGGLVAAWATSVLVALIVGCIYAIYSGGGLSSLKLPDASSAIFVISFFFCLVSSVVGMVVTMVLGIPIFKGFVVLGYTSPIAFSGAGLLTSLVLACALYIGHRFRDVLDDSGFQFALIAIFASGLLGGLSFWAIYRRNQGYPKVDGHEQKPTGVS